MSPLCNLGGCRKKARNISTGIVFLPLKTTSFSGYAAECRRTSLTLGTTGLMDIRVEVASVGNSARELRKQLPLVEIFYPYP